MKQVQSKQLIGRIRGFSVYSVSAFEIRDLEEEEDEEFGLYSVWLDLPNLIPRDEIWLAKEGEAEWGIFLQGALAWLATGFYEEALKAERLARGGLRLGSITDVFYLRYIRSIPDPVEPIEVWFVDGKLVRDNFKTDWVEGGHPYVYPWIPKGQIWIADSVEAEWPFLLIHEYAELCLMRDKCMPYDEAHQKADDAEWSARQKRKSNTRN